MHTKSFINIKVTSLPGLPAVNLWHSKTSLLLGRYFHEWCLSSKIKGAKIERKIGSSWAATKCCKRCPSTKLKHLSNILGWRIFERWSYRAGAAASRPSARRGCGRRSSRPPCRSRSGLRGDRDPAGTEDSAVWFWNNGLCSPLKCEPGTCKAKQSHPAY